MIFASRPDVLNHNVETVPRLQRAVRPSAGYARSLSVLARARAAGLSTKSGLVVGMGETDDEVVATLADLAGVGVDIVTIGQYLRPTSHHLPVHRWVTPAQFEAYKAAGEEMGIGPRRVEPAHPLELPRPPGGRCRLRRGLSGGSPGSLAACTLIVWPASGPPWPPRASTSACSRSGPICPGSRATRPCRSNGSPCWSCRVTTTPRSWSPTSRCHASWSAPTCSVSGAGERPTIRWPSWPIWSVPPARPRSATTPGPSSSSASSGGVPR